MGPQERRHRNVEPFHDAAQLLAGPLGLQVPSLLLPAEDHKKPATGLLTFLKLPCLPKASLRQGSRTKGGTVGVSQVEFTCHKAVSPWRGIRCIMRILGGCIILIVVYCLHCSPKIQNLVILDAVQIYERLSCMERLLLCKQSGQEKSSSVISVLQMRQLEEKKGDRILPKDTQSLWVSRGLEIQASIQFLTSSFNLCTVHNIIKNQAQRRQYLV